MKLSPGDDAVLYPRPFRMKKLDDVGSFQPGYQGGEPFFKTEDTTYAKAMKPLSISQRISYLSLAFSSKNLRINVTHSDDNSGRKLCRLR